MLYMRGSVWRACGFNHPSPDRLDGPTGFTDHIRLREGPQVCALRHGTHVATPCLRRRADVCLLQPTNYWKNAQQNGITGGVLEVDQPKLALVTRTVLKPTHMIGAYAQQSYGFNYYGTVGSNRDEFVVVRKMKKVDWLDKEKSWEAPAQEAAE